MGSGEACCVVGRMRYKALEAVVWGVEKLSYVTVADRVPQYLRFSQYWGTFFILFSLYVAFCNYFISSVPRYFILSNFRGTFLFLHIICVLIFIAFYGFVPQIFTILKCRGTLALILTCFIQHIVCIR